MEDSLMQSLMNFGGLGVALAMLFYLHTQSLRTLREEMQRERDRCDQHLKEERLLWKEGMGELFKRLDRLEAKLDRVSAGG